MLEYVMVPDSSGVRVFTHKSGLLRFAGHEHTIAMTGLTGTTSVDPTDLTHFTLVLKAPTASFEVVDAEEDPETRAKIQKTMQEEVLDVGRFAFVTFRGMRLEVEGSAAVPGAFRGDLTGELELHGIRREMTIPIEIIIDHERLHARGRFSIRHRDYGLKRIKVVRLVNVAERIDVTFDVQGQVRTSGAQP